MVISNTPFLLYIEPKRLDIKPNVIPRMYAAKNYIGGGSAAYPIADRVFTYSSVHSNGDKLTPMLEGYRERAARGEEKYVVYYETLKPHFDAAKKGVPQNTDGTKVIFRVGASTRGTHRCQTLNKNSAGYDLLLPCGLITNTLALDYLGFTLDSIPAAELHKIAKIVSGYPEDKWFDTEYWEYIAKKGDYLPVRWVAQILE